MKILNSFFTPISLFVIIYRIFLDIIYSTIIVEAYDYQHYIFNPSINSIIISWFLLITILPFIVYCSRGNNLSSIILFLFGLFSFVPTSTMIAFNSQYNITYIILIYVYWLLFFIVTIKMPTIYLNFKTNSFFFINVLIFLIVGSVIYVSYRFTGFRFHFGLMDVYDLRVEAREYSVPTVFNYLLSAADYVLIFVLIYFITLKKYFLSIIFFILNLLNFGISGSKHIVFLLFLSLSVYLIFKTKDVRKYILPFLIIVLSLSLIEYKYYETNFLTLFLSYRVLFIPSKLHYIYYDYFSNHDFDYFRQSFMKFFLVSPYKENIGFIIGEFDTGAIEGRANNGLFSDAFFNLGIIGVLIFPLALAFILKLFDGAVRSLNKRFYFSIALSIFLALLSLPLTTALLSSGLLFFLILLYNIPRYNVFNTLN